MESEEEGIRVGLETGALHVFVALGPMRVLTSLFLARWVKEVGGEARGGHDPGASSVEPFL